jgi:hypothetical protein
VAIVCWKGEVITVTNKLTKKSFRKQYVRIIDQSNTAVYLTVWAEMVSTGVKFICKLILIVVFVLKIELFSDEEHPVVLLNNAQVSVYNVRTLVLSKNSVLQINPDISETIALKQWCALQNA